MSVIDTLVTDRTPDGYYGADDLNRVEQAMTYLQDRLVGCGFDISVSPTVWSDSNLPKPQDVNHLLHDLNTIRDALAFPGMPILPDGKRPFTAAEANEIERMLMTVDQTVSTIINSYWCAGEAVAGDV